nr:hypothetical protein EUGRSUZ_B02882 [Ipomoea batatas]
MKPVEAKQQIGDRDIKQHKYENDRINRASGLSAGALARACRILLMPALKIRRREILNVIQFQLRQATHLTLHLILQPFRVISRQNLGARPTRPFVLARSSRHEQRAHIRRAHHGAHPFHRERSVRVPDLQLLHRAQRAKPPTHAQGLGVDEKMAGAVLQHHLCCVDRFVKASDLARRENHRGAFSLPAHWP